MELVTEQNTFTSGYSWVQVQVKAKGQAVWDAFASMKVLVKIEIPHTSLYFSFCDDFHCPASYPDTNLDPNSSLTLKPSFTAKTAP